MQKVFAVKFENFSLEKGFPSITGDGRRHILVSEHNNAFRGAWGRAAQRVKKVMPQQQQVLMVMI